MRGVSFCSVLFSLFVSVTLGFFWQHVHCRQWTRNHQHRGDPVLARTCLGGATCHYPSRLYRRGIAIVYVDEETSKQDGVFRFIFYVFFLFWPYPSWGDVDITCFHPNYLVLLNDTNSVPKVLWKHNRLMIWPSKQLMVHLNEWVL